MLVGSPNVLQMIERFNQVSLWAASSILGQEKLADRVISYRKLISIAEHLRKMNNFNSLLAIISGLNDSAVFRLKFTLAEVGEKVNKVESYWAVGNFFKRCLKS